MSDMNNSFSSGVVALVGRPNVGKSTLMNRILGQKISIVTHKPQTTRHRIAGIHTTEQGQIVFLDTPGLHSAATTQLNRHMNRVARASLAEADLVVLVVRALQWRDDDEQVLDTIRQSGRPAALVINQVDRVSRRERLLPFIEEVAARHGFAFVVPLSAGTGDNVAALEKELLQALPAGPFLYEADQITDRSERFLVAEMVREQLMLGLQQEIPYGTTVEVEAFARERGILNVSALVWVNREAHKAIVIGRGGQRLKAMGRAARLAIEREFDEKVYLRLYVKVRAGWADDDNLLRQLGYEAE